MKEHKHGPIVVEDADTGLGNLTIYVRHAPDTKLTIEHADRWDLLAAVMSAQGQAPFDKRCADAMADAIDFMVRTKLIDSRSPAADALLSYRGGAPTSTRSDQLVALETRNAELRETLAKLSRETAYPDEVKNWLEQLHKERIAALDVKDAEIAQERASKDGAYRERNQLAVAFAHMALGEWMDNGGSIAKEPCGWYAGVGRHQPDPDPTWDPQWLTVLFIDTPAGQLSWHMHDSDKPLLEGLPKYLKPWDGHTTVEKYDRLEKLFQFTKVAS